MTEATVSRRATIALALVLAALGAIAVVPAHVNHDAAWYLYMADRWFDGATLYRDVIDTNPPLIVWLTALPAGLARLAGTSAPALFKLFVFALAGASVVATHRYVVAAWPARAFVLTSLTAFLCLPFAKQDFGQREHVAVLLTLPYVVAAVVETPNRWRALIIGACAGLGFLIKPHFVVAATAVEVAVFVQRRRRAWRLELVAAAVAAALYIIAVALIVPDYLGVAAQVREVYGGLNSPVASLIRLREVQLWFAAAFMFVALRWPAGERLPAMLFAAATGYLAAALLQLKGWGYHLYPARVFTVLFLVAAFLVVLEQLPAIASVLRGGRRGLGYLFAGILVIASARYIVEAQRPPTPDLVTPTIELLRGHAAGGPVVVLSMRTIVYPAFPSVNYSGVTWGLRHNSLWFLPGFYREQNRAGGGPLEGHAIAEMPPLEKVFFDQVVEDLCAAPPQIVGFEDPLPSAPAGRRALDLLSYYRQSPRLVPLLDSYELLARVGQFTFLRRARENRCG